jgi:hypothetical protein
MMIKNDGSATSSERHQFQANAGKIRARALARSQLPLAT